MEEPARNTRADRLLSPLAATEASGRESSLFERLAMVLAVFPSRRGMVPAVRRFIDFLLANVVAGVRIVT